MSLHLWHRKATLVLTGTFLGIVGFLLMQHFVSGADSENRVAQLEQLHFMSQKQSSFEDFVSFFTEVAHAQGGEYAFSLMKEADLPFGLDTHLLGHYIGDVFYEQAGIMGMNKCTHDFRNACSHTMVIGALMEFGEGAFADIQSACKQAPGGTGAYTMCFHGLGHGILAFNDYDIEKTVAMCERFSTEEYANQEAVECFGGAIMEIIGGGGHNAALWEEKRSEYLLPDDPFGLCESDLIDEQYVSMCYIYMTPFAFESLGANMAAPSDQVISDTFAYCDALPISEEQKREACFGGLGKEFIGLATGRDFTQFDAPPPAALKEMYRLCRLTDASDGVWYCTKSVVDSLYWGAENSFAGPINFCGLEESAAMRSDCYEWLTQKVEEYNKDEEYRSYYCQALPSAEVDNCLQSLL